MEQEGSGTVGGCRHAVAPGVVEHAGREGGAAQSKERSGEVMEEPGRGEAEEEDKAMPSPRAVGGAGSWEHQSLEQPSPLLSPGPAEEGLVAHHSERVAVLEASLAIHPVYDPYQWSATLCTLRGRPWRMLLVPMLILTMEAFVWCS